MKKTCFMNCYYDNISADDGGQTSCSTIFSYNSKTVRLYPFVSTSNDPCKGWRIPLNEIKYNEQRDEETGIGYCDTYQPHAPRRIKDTENQRLYDLQWDRAGNLGQCNTAKDDGFWLGSRHLFWTADNRMHSAVDADNYSYYTYDYSGERTLKLTGRNSEMDVNAELQHTSAALDCPTLYPSPYLVMGMHGYTKHYYAGTERICAKTGGGFGESITRSFPDLQAAADSLFGQSRENIRCRELLQNDMECVVSYGHVPDAEMNVHLYEMPSHFRSDAEIHLGEFHSVVEWCEHEFFEEDDVFFYHSDHLGSASWITDAQGDAVQHLQYLPFGEPFVDQRISGYSERFRFTGKERDEETGYGYFGARYMDHELLTTFLSVDRYADKYPSISPYAYCAWNPLRITDPNGDSLRLEGTAEQRQKVLDYLHQYSHLTFQCDGNGYVTLNTDLPGSEIKNYSDRYIDEIIKDGINISVIEITETDNVASKGVRMQKDNPTLFGATSDYPKDGNWETGRVEGRQFLNINLLGDICGNDSESKTYPGRIVMHEFSEGFEGCKLARELQRPLTMSQKDYIFSHWRANKHVWGEFTPPGDNGKIKLRSEYIGK